jgi:Tfp pilus assembly protein PilO
MAAGPGKSSASAQHSEATQALPPRPPRAWWVLNWRDPGTWTKTQRILACTALALMCGALCQTFWLSDSQATLSAQQAQEQVLRQQLQAKLRHNAQRLQQHLDNRNAEQALLALEAKLPQKNSMDSLLDSISRAGTVQGLQFETFKPQPVQALAPYAEQHIQLRLHGSFGQMMAFFTELAQLPRLFALTDLHLQINKAGLLSLDTVVKILQPLDAAEATPTNHGAARSKSNKLEAHQQ